MTELWDVYDINKNTIGKVVERETYKFQKGEYHLITVAVIMNSKKQILIAKRSERKKGHHKMGIIRRGSTSRRK